MFLPSGNAKVDGLIPDLKMTNGQYNAALSLFFVSYALFEPLTNVLIKTWRPRVFLTLTITLWGVVMVCMGLVHNFSGLAAARFFLGVAEAGLFPGVNYYLSCWYKRSEFGIRAAIFFSAAALAGSFGGLLAAAIAKMKGIGGKQGWAWVCCNSWHWKDVSLADTTSDFHPRRTCYCAYWYCFMVDGPRLPG
jgi:MFS family permease